MTNWLRRYDLNPATGAVLIFLGCFSWSSCSIPWVYVFSNAFFTADGFSLVFMKLMFSSPNNTIILANSVNLGLAVTLFTIGTQSSPSLCSWYATIFAARAY